MKITISHTANVMEKLRNSEANVESVEIRDLSVDTLLPSISRILYGDEGSFDVVGIAFTTFMPRRAIEFGKHKHEIAKFFPLEESLSSIGNSYQYSI